MFWFFVRVASWFWSIYFSRQARYQASFDVEVSKEDQIEAHRRKPKHPSIQERNMPIYSTEFGSGWLVFRTWTTPEECSGSVMIWRTWTTLWASTFYQGRLASMTSQPQEPALGPSAEPPSKHCRPSQPTCKLCRWTSTVYSNFLVEIAFEAEGRRGVTTISKRVLSHPMVQPCKIPSVKWRGRCVVYRLHIFLFFWKTKKQD
jgi:hypothetical protein